MALFTFLSVLLLPHCILLTFASTMCKTTRSRLDNTLSRAGVRRITKDDKDYTVAANMIASAGKKPDDGDAEEDADWFHKAFRRIGLSKAYLPYPQDDPFYGVYTAASALQGSPPGTILQSRSIKLKGFPGLDADSLQAWEIAYVTQDDHDKLSRTVATIVKPPNAKTDFILGHLPKTDAAIPQCRTTYALRKGTAARFGSLSETVFFENYLDQGWTVFIPDYQGQFDVFGSGPVAGRAVLDATRAVLSFSNQTGLSPDARVAYYGYSSGAMACAWTAQLQGSYAPELSSRMVGFAMGGTPVDIHQVAKHIQNSIAAGLTLGVFIGLSNVYPQITQFLKDSLTPEGDKLYDLPRQGCFKKFMFAAVEKDVLTREFWKIDNPLESEVILPILDTLKCGESTDEKQIPKSAPLFIAQSLKDEVVPTDQVDNLVDKWSKAGAAIEYIRDETPGHVVLSFTSFPTILKWLKHRVEGEPCAAKPGKPVIKNVKTSLLIGDQDEAKEMLTDGQQQRLQATMDQFKERPWFA